MLKLHTFKALKKVNFQKSLSYALSNQTFSNNSSSENLKELYTPLSHEGFLNLLEIAQNSNKLSHKTIYELKTYLERSEILYKPEINKVMTSVININNEELTKALEQNVKTKIQVNNLVKAQEEKESLEAFVSSRKKIKRLFSFNLKIFLGAFLITSIFRLYYYIEHDIDILEPRVSSYHIYRFR